MPGTLAMRQSLEQSRMRGCTRALRLHLAGSTADFLEYVRSHDKLRVCSKEGVRASRKRWRRIKECVFALPEMVRNMTSLSADPVLGSRETVDARLAAARLVRCRTHWRLGALMNLSLFSPAYIPHY